LEESAAWEESEVSSSKENFTDLGLSSDDADADIDANDEGASEQC
jgi:hypothetical protein